MRIRIKALDTLFFRDGKPFDLAENSWATGIFPPPPSVFYGALRSLYLSENGYSKENIKASEHIQIQQIYYKIKGQLYLPAPLDLVELKYKRDSKEERRQLENKENLNKEYEVVKLQLNEKEFISSSSLTSRLNIPNNKEGESVSDGLITSTDLQTYLDGNLTTANILKIKDWRIEDPKVGIGRSNVTHTTDEGKLYRVGMSRFKDLEILLELKQSDVFSFKPTQQFLKLGGEGKATYLNFPKKSADKLSIQPTLKDAHFKIYLLTPAIFNGGVNPDLSKLGIEAKLLTASIGKPLHIGGFDMEERKPKPMKKAVPAGSVYYYSTQQDLQDISNKIHNKSISDDRKNEGFGIAFIGNF